MDMIDYITGSELSLQPLSPPWKSGDRAEHANGLITTWPNPEAVWGPQATSHLRIMPGASAVV